MTKMMWMIALFAGALMAQGGPLANGIYAVADGSGAAPDRVTRQYEGKDLVLNAANFAPLVLDGKPQIGKDARGSYLMVQLAPDAAKRLEDLSRSQMNRRIAVVVEDKILSAPTVRSVISDGKARVTPCDDGTCEALLRKLSH